MHDLRNPASPAHPESPLANPLDAFHFAANPGGRWRIPLDIESSLSSAEEVDKRSIQARELTEQARATAEAGGDTVRGWVRSATKRSR